MVGVLEMLRGLGLLSYYVNIEGGRRDVRQQVALKRAGVRPGRPDLQILMPDGQGFHIEVKRVPGGRLSEYQKGEIENNERLGHETFVVKAETPEDGVNQLWEILNSKGSFEKCLTHCRDKQ